MNLFKDYLIYCKCTKQNKNDASVLYEYIHNILHYTIK